MAHPAAPARSAARARVWNGLVAGASVALMLVVLVGASSAADRLTVVVPATFVAVGWIVLRHDPSHVEGRLVLATGLAWGLALTTPFEGSWVLPVGLMGTHLLLRYPSGLLPSPRWRWFARVCTAMIVMCTVVVSTASQTREAGGPNPYYVSWTEPLGILLVALPACMLGSVASVFIRYRRASVLERTQIRWLAAAAALVVVLYLITLATSFGYDWTHEVDSTQSAWFATRYPWWLQTLQLSSLFSFVLIPAAFGIAITRYRLYDIDRIISRTTSYAIVTALVLGTYGIVVSVVLRLLPDASNVAVAAATLTAAAIARPAVRRVQRVVDRRFDRTRYDQVRTLEAFGDDVRHAVDPHAVSEQLLETVRSALQPGTASLWAQPPR